MMRPSVGCNRVFLICTWMEIASAETAFALFKCCCVLCRCRGTRIGILFFRKFYNDLSVLKLKRIRYVLKKCVHLVVYVCVAKYKFISPININICAKNIRSESGHSFNTIWFNFKFKLIFLFLFIHLAKTIKSQKKVYNK